MAHIHFSHPHNLTFQQLQNGPEIHCSGCKSPATGPIYICWQCSFFLHEQCYLASRSLNHHSHPSHPLTLIPYPTYPSGSFICNSCNQTGTGFSFSCSYCDFDLHVHCAYNPQTTSHESPHPFGPTQTYSVPIENQTNVHPQFPYPPITIPPESSYPNFPNPNAQYSFITQTAKHEPIFNNPPNETVQSFNVQLVPQSSTHGSIGQTVVNQPFQNISSFQPQIGNHHSDMHQPFQNIPNLQHPPPYEAVPSFNAKTPPEATEISSNASKPVNISASSENQQKLQGVKHFSHDHTLLFSEIKEENGIICSGCEQKVSGSAYTCAVSNCNFNLHNSCFGLPQEIKKHKSHPEHPLSLLSIPPYKEHHQFTCNACLENGGAFVYNCSTCKFDLHVDCAFLPETVDRKDHEHSLALLYSAPFKKVKEDDLDIIFICDVCRTIVDQRCWAYYCQDCDFGTHSGCITSEQCPQEERPQEVAELAMILETQSQLQRLQLQMQIGQQNAQFMANIGQRANFMANMGQNVFNSI